MYFSPKSNQRRERRLVFVIDGSVPELDIGNGLGTLVENSDGNYTITFNKAFTRTPACLHSVNSDVSTTRLVAISTTAVQIEQVGADQTTPLADSDITLEVIGWDTADEYSELT